MTEKKDEDILVLCSKHNIEVDDDLKCSICKDIPLQLYSPKSSQATKLVKTAQVQRVVRKSPPVQGWAEKKEET